MPKGEERNKKNGKPKSSLKATHISKSVDIFFTKGGMKSTHLEKMHSRAKMHPPVNETNLGLFPYFTPTPVLFWWGRGQNPLVDREGKENQAFYVVSVSVFGIIEE